MLCITLKQYLKITYNGEMYSVAHTFKIANAKHIQQLFRLSVYMLSLYIYYTTAPSNDRNTLHVVYELSFVVFM